MKTISKIILGLGIGGLLISMKYFDIVIPLADSGLEDIYSKYSNSFASGNLLRAVAIVESGEKADAYNPNDPSYGLMQILYTGSNKFYIDGWPPTSADDLYNPDYNVKLGAQILGWNIKTYGFMRGIMCFNNWSARVGNIPAVSWDYFLKVLITYYRIR